MYPYLAKGRNAHTWFTGKWLVYWDVCLTGSIEQEEIFFCFKHGLSLLLDSLQSWKEIRCWRNKNSLASRVYVIFR